MDWSEIIKIVPPSNIVSLIVIVLMFRAAEKKDKIIERLGNIVHHNSEVTSNQTTLLNTLLGGRS